MPWRHNPNQLSNAGAVSMQPSSSFLEEATATAPSLQDAVHWHDCIGAAVSVSLGEEFYLVLRPRGEF